MTARQRRQQRRFLVRGFIFPSACFAALLAIVYASGIDFIVADAFYDVAAGRFLWRDDFWLKKVLHDGGDRLIVAVAVTSLVTYAAGLFYRPASRYRRRAGYVVLCIVLTTSLVQTIKRFSNIDCPWSLTRYGGDRPYLYLYESRPPTLPPAACFPGAHSSGAFALGAIVLLLTGWRAVVATGTIAGLGLLYAATQWARGAHFVSHDVWSAWLAWLVCVSCHRVLFRTLDGGLG